MPNVQLSHLRGANESYPLTNPILDCEVNEGGVLEKGIIPFGPRLRKFAQGKIDSAAVTDLAVYYRDLNNGPWLGLNEKEKYIPASLIKIPILIAYYKAAEKDPEVLAKKIPYDGGSPSRAGVSQLIHPSKQLEAGKEYTADELIERAIRYSDNDAAQLLIAHIDNALIFDAFRRIGVADEVLRGPGGKISPRDYSSFFRILYNASYLNREMSEKALRLLTRVEEKRGLPAGIPENASVAVAHKFGEAGVMEEGLVQYHDCGIVYHPRRPYLLCVMTRGNDYESLMRVIQEISRFVYEEVDTQTSLPAK